MIWNICDTHYQTKKNLGEFPLLSYFLDIKMSDGTTCFCLITTTTATKKKKRNKLFLVLSYLDSNYVFDVSNRCIMTHLKKFQYYSHHKKKTKEKKQNKKEEETRRKKSNKFWA